MDNLMLEVNEWIIFSDRDLKTARHIYDTMQPVPLEIVCYHCQQSAEKALKAFLIQRRNRGIISAHLLCMGIRKTQTKKDI